MKKSNGWFYAKNGEVKEVVSKPFTMGEYKAEKALKEFVKDFGKKGGKVVPMNPKKAS